MLRKRDSERHFYQKVNGYAPEKVVSEFIFYPLNGYAPEKNAWFGHYVHFFTILWTNEHQKQAIMPPSGVDYASEFLNGYAPEYVPMSNGPFLSSKYWYMDISNLYDLALSCFGNIGRFTSNNVYYHVQIHWICLK